MKTKLFVAFSLVLCFGLTYGHNSNHSTSGQSSTADRSDPWNPLAELLGLKDAHGGEEQEEDDLFGMFEKHNREMDKAMKEHQEVMDKAMDEHHRVLDDVFSGLKPVLDSAHKSVMAQHQAFMNRGMAQHEKGMHDFDKNWAQFDKNMDQMFKEFDSHFEEISAPFEAQPIPQKFILWGKSKKEEQPIVETEEKLTEKEGGAKNKTGLPVFHPNKTMNAPVEDEYYDVPALINNIMDGFKPVLDDLQKEVQDRINSSYQLAEKTVEDKSNDNSTAGKLFSNFMDNVVTSVAQLGKIVNGLIGYDNQTDVAVVDKHNDTKAMECGCPLSFLNIHKEDCPMNMTQNGQIEVNFQIGKESAVNGLDGKLKIAYILHALENVLMARMTQVVFEDTDTDVENLLRLGYNEDDIKAAQEKVIEILKTSKEEIPIGLVWSKEPWEVYDIQVDYINKMNILDNVVQVVSGRLLSYAELQRKQFEAEKNKLSAHKYIEKQLKREFKLKHDDNDYEWYEWLTIGLIGTTSTLLLIVALFMCVQRSRHCRSLKLDVEEGPKGNGVANENLSNKYKEKIKTIFVNLKA